MFGALLTDGSLVAGMVWLWLRLDRHTGAGRFCGWCGYSLRGLPKSAPVPRVRAAGIGACSRAGRLASYSMSDEGRLITWAALLAKWTDFARSAVALPKDGEGGLLRRAVPAIIALQAVTNALGELELLGIEEQPLALDRAEILIDRHGAEINALWGSTPVRSEVAAIIGEARAALRAARDRVAGAG